MSTVPCAACKCRRQKCTKECVFAPHFPPEDPQKFVNIHTVFGASNIAKILQDLHPNQRGDAVHSLAYEALSRLQDPVYGCFGIVAFLQDKLRQVQHNLECAKKELATYGGPSSMTPMLNHPNLLQQQQQQNMAHSVVPMIPHQFQQMAIARDQEMLRAYAQQQQQQMQQQMQQQIHQQIQQEGLQVDDTEDFVADHFNHMAATIHEPLLTLGGSYQSEINHDHIQQHSRFQSNPHSLPQHQHEQQQSLETRWHISNS